MCDCITTRHRALLHSTQAIYELLDSWTCHAAAASPTTPVSAECADQVRAARVGGGGGCGCAAGWRPPGAGALPVAADLRRHRPAVVLGPKPAGACVWSFAAQMSLIVPVHAMQHSCVMHACCTDLCAHGGFHNLKSHEVSSCDLMCRPSRSTALAMMARWTPRRRQWPAPWRTCRHWRE